MTTSNHLNLVTYLRISQKVITTKIQMDHHFVQRVKRKKYLESIFLLIQKIQYTFAKIINATIDAAMQFVKHVIMN
jgi:hypothetical protein